MTEPHHQTGFANARVKTLLAVMFCYLFYYTGRQNFGFAIPGMSEELGLSKTQLGWCSTALLWAYAIGQAINGQLADRFGGRKLMTLGGMLSFVMNWVTSFAGGLAGVLVPWAGNGFVQSMGWAPGSRILSNWWDRIHRGRVYGWYVFAAGMSSVVTFGLAAVAVDHHHGAVRAFGEQGIDKGHGRGAGTDDQVVGLQDLVMNHLHGSNTSGRRILVGRLIALIWCK